jgi:hypothetical protein
LDGLSAVGGRYPGRGNHGRGPRKVEPSELARISAAAFVEIRPEVEPDALRQASPFE